MLQQEYIRHEDIAPEHALLTGRMSPTPRDLWYFAQRKDGDKSHYWNVAKFVEVLHPLDPAIVRQAVKYLLAQHDALRLRLKRDTSGYYYTFASLDDETPFASEDLSELPEADLPGAIQARARDYHLRLNLEEGPLIQVVLFYRGPQKTQRLLLIVSHGVCDAISLHILMNDFVAFYAQIEQGLPVHLRPRKTSLKEWTEIKVQYARTREFQEELLFWRSLPWTSLRPLPMDYPENRAANTRESVCTITTTLSPEETSVLLHEAPRAMRSQIRDILLAPLMQTLKQWTGSGTHALFLNHHGRITPFAGVDLSRTVGNLAVVPQVVLDAGKARTLWEMALSIKEQLHRIPSAGLMWEWLPVDMFPKPDIAFNYLGEVRLWNHTGSSWFRPAPESAGPSEDPHDQHWTLLVCTALIIRRQFSLSWGFSKNLYNRETVEALAQEYMRLLRIMLQSRAC